MQKKTLNLLPVHGFAFSQHHCTVTEQDYDEFDNKLSTLLKSWEMDNGIYSVCDLNRKNFLYTCPALQNVLGINKPLEWCPGSKNGIYGYIHPDDLAFVLDTEIMVYEFLSKLRWYERLDYRLMYEFRLIGAKNALYRIINMVKVFEYDRYGNSWLLLVKSHLMCGMSKEETLRRFLFSHPTKELWLFTNGNGKKPQKLLSDREREILGLVAQGHDNTYITKKLFISIYTLSRHKQNIIEKTNTSNIIQALSYASILGLV